jgi:hypothetical protein
MRKNDVVIVLLLALDLPGSAKYRDRIGNWKWVNMNEWCGIVDGYKQYTWPHFNYYYGFLSTYLFLINP